MSLDLRSLYFQNILIKCLSIESVEYCYFIPIISQLAEYWGDVKMACLCKIMSRQVKQNLTFLTDIHYFLLLKESQKDSSIKYPLLFDTQLQILFKNKELVSSRLFSLSDNQSQRLGIDEKKIIPLLQNIDHSFFYFLENGTVSEGNPVKRKFLYELFPISTAISSSSFFASSFETTSNIENFFWNYDFPKTKQGFNNVLKRKNDKMIEKSGNIMSPAFRKNRYFFLLQILRDRKIWKAEQWYPFVSTLSLNSKLFCETIPNFSKSSSLVEESLFLKPPKIKKKCFDQIEEELSFFFKRLSQSEKKMSHVITLLLTK